MSELLSDTQREFRDTIRKFLTQECGTDLLRAVFEGSDGSARQRSFEEKLASVGLYEFFEALPAEGGGTGRDVGMVAEELGRVLAPTWILDSIIASEWLPRRIVPGGFNNLIVEGCQRDSAFEPLRQSVSTSSRPVGALGVMSQRAAPTLQVRPRSGAVGDRISGEARFVPVVTAAQYFVLPAVGSDGRMVGVIVPTGVTAPALTRQSEERCLDRTQRRELVRFNDAPCLILPDEATRQLAALSAVMRASELAGIAQRVVGLTTEYVKTRKQFGAPIGGFQAVQHKLADAYLHAEATSSVAAFAAWALDQSPEQVEFASRAAIMYAVDQVPVIVETAIQLHGGIGFTWEYELHLFLRRARSIAALYGSVGEDDAQLLQAALTA